MKTRTQGCLTQKSQVYCSFTFVYVKLCLNELHACLVFKLHFLKAFVSCLLYILLVRASGFLGFR